jgi:putative pyoverdin transport system ATP-binding/permease protein
MHLLNLLRVESTIDLRKLIFMAVLAGLSNAMVLALINAAAGRDPFDDNGMRLALLFIVVLILYTISQRYLLTESAREIERILHRIRTRLIEAVRHCELRDVERIGRSRIYDGISKEIQSLAQSTNVLVIIAQMAILVVFTTLYLITLSMTAFLLAAGFLTAATIIYLARAKRLQHALDEANSAESRLHELLIGVLDGFKEIKLNRKRSESLAGDVIEASLVAADARTKSKVGNARSFLFTQNVFFLLLGTMVFIVPALSHTYGTVVVKSTTAILFVFGPISGIVSAVPVYAAADASAAFIMELEALLTEHATITEQDPAEIPLPATFREIIFRDVLFTYPDHGEHPFTVGPINLTLRAGENVFISGGNGSGKSTLLRLLTTLYWPQAGSISVDGTIVTHENAASYRALFSSVFSDFHLFKRLYGVEPSAMHEALDLLGTFEVADKTRLQEDAFTTIDLSDGQRKRLALIVAMLENRPICILDEWAADQDPVFRRKFYVELLEALRARNVTVISVTHDDRYYARADRRLHMEEGKLVSIAPEAASA